MKKIYMASHFFEAGGKLKTQQLADKLRQELTGKIDLYVPQENGEINDKTQAVKYITDIDISEGDNKYLDEADFLIADLDGVETDAGVSAEVGYIAGKNKMIEEYNKLARDCGLPLKKPIRILGFTTDIRINHTTEQLVKDLQNTGDISEIKFKLSNIKENNLYRNLYVRGLINSNGLYRALTPENYLEEITKTIKTFINYFK